MQQIPDINTLICLILQDPEYLTEINLEKNGSTSSK